MTTDQAPAPGVIGNERLTASAGGALLFLLAVELATAAVLRVQMSAHVFIGVLLIGPTADPWIGWAQSNEQIPAPIIVGAVLTVAALAVGRPARWTSNAPPDPSPTA